MKFTAIIYICIATLFVSCKIVKEPTQKIYIKSVEVSKGVRIDWYVYSSITSFAPDYLQISTIDKSPLFTSFFLSDINFRNDSLFISLWKSGYKLDSSGLNGIKVTVDTLGGPWNQAGSRIGRLNKRGVIITEPHFVDTYCERGECDGMP